MTFRDVLGGGPAEGVPWHEHDGSDISGEIVASVIKAEQFLGGIMTGKEFIVAGGTDGIIRSDNFVLGSAGWRILGDGNAEFNDVIVRGTIIAGAGSSIGFDDVTAATNTVALIIGGSGTVRSSNFSAGSAGWTIEADGSAEFNDVTVRGTVFATAGEIGGLTIVDTLTLATGAVFRTAASGKRIEIAFNTFDTIRFFDGVATQSGLIFVDTKRLRIRPPHNVTSNTPEIDMDGDLAEITFKSNNINVVKTGHDGSFPFVAVPGSGTGSVLLKGTTGSAANPPYSFWGDTDLGWYRSGTNKMAVTTGGVNRGDWSSAGLFINVSGSAATPSLLINDLNTGLFLVASNTLGVTTGGVERAKFDLNGLNLTTHVTTGSAANAFIVASGGLLQRSTSARKYKTHESPAPYLADVVLAPVKFYREDDDAWYYGFTADDLGNQDMLLGEYGEDGIENYDYRAVMAVMAAKINRLEHQVERLLAA